MRLIIAGGRDYSLSEDDFSKLNSINDVTEVVSGCAKGVDSDGEAWGQSQGLDVQRFKPDWARYKRGAGLVRNKEMAVYADAVALFPGGRGTNNMYEVAKKARLKIFDYRSGA